MENMELYEKYREVPKEALKAFDNGNFKGTDINTMWRIKCLTQEFGPCGVGWYPEPVHFWSEPGANGEVLCFAEIKLFIKYNGEWSKGIPATGGSKLASFIKSRGELKSSDEGYKMAFTDALGVACKYLGFGANVYWENDKTKYTDGVEGATPPSGTTPTGQNPPPPTGGLIWTPEELSEARDYSFDNGKKAGIPFSEYNDAELNTVIENVNSPIIVRYAKIVLAAKRDKKTLPF